MEIYTLGIDLGKAIFHVVGLKPDIIRGAVAPPAEEKKH
jgi:hypothetical protein